MIKKTDRVELLPLTDIWRGARFRKDYKTNVDELILSIEEVGLLQPVVVAELGTPILVGEKSFQYALLAGGRRCAAHHKMEQINIMSCIYETDLTWEQIKDDTYLARKIELEENLQRLDLTWQERLALTQEVDRLYVAEHGGKVARDAKAPGWTQRDTAAALGKSPATVSRDLHLARAIEDMPELANAKTQKDAQKRLLKIEEGLILAELTRRYIADPDSDRITLDQRKLVESYIVGDFLELGPDLPQEFYHVAEIDPPYAIDLTNVARGIDSVHDKDDYNEISSEEYPAFMQDVLRITYNALQPNAWLIVWFAPHPWWADMLRWIGEAGFSVRGLPGVWYKMSGPGQTMHPEIYMGSNWEPFFYARKGKAALARPGRSNVFGAMLDPPKTKTHPTQRPVFLMKEILSTFMHPGNHVLVPFAGSGNTLRAAQLLGAQSCVGFDKTERYRDLFVEGVLGE